MGNGQSGARATTTEQQSSGTITQSQKGASLSAVAAAAAAAGPAARLWKHFLPIEEDDENEHFRHKTMMIFLPREKKYVFSTAYSLTLPSLRPSPLRCLRHITLNPFQIRIHVKLLKILLSFTTTQSTTRAHIYTHDLYTEIRYRCYIPRKNGLC